MYHFGQLVMIATIGNADLVIGNRMLFYVVVDDVMVPRRMRYGRRDPDKIL